MNSNAAQHWLCDPDISQACILKQWLEEELHIAIHHVESIDIQTDMHEIRQAGQYKQFEQGKFSCFVLTLLDGSKLHRSFRRGD